MRKLFGHPARFAIEIGEFQDESDQLRRVDVWAADRWLTCDDNIAFVPHFIGQAEGSVRYLIGDHLGRRFGRPYPELSPADNHRRLSADAVADNTEYRHYMFMDWGPTADNVSMLLFQEGDTAFLPFSFWREAHHDPAERGQVFVAELPWRELAGVLHDAAWALMWAWADRSKWPGR